MEIIKADKSHFPAIRDIAMQTWPDTFAKILSKEQISYMLEMMYSIPSLEKQTEQDNHVFLLAQEDNEYFGYLSYELNYKNLSKTKIHKIYILPKSQGKGVGKLLINKVNEIALDAEQQILALNVNRDNKAVDFYKKIGFSIIGTEDIDIGNNFLMEDYIMEKSLI